MKNHPASEMFPLMKDHEYQSLKAEIKAHGLIQPITLFEGMLLDGRHRYRACTELGIQPASTEFKRNGRNEWEFVAAVNGERRSLTKSQLATSTVAYRVKLKEEYEKRKGVKQPDSKRSATDAAKLFGVGETYVIKATSIHLKNPKLFKQVFNGEISLDKAWKAMKSQGLVRKPEGHFVLGLKPENDAKAWEIITQLTGERGGWRCQIDRAALDNKVQFYGKCGVEAFLSWKYIKSFRDFTDAVYYAARDASLKEMDD